MGKEPLEERARQAWSVEVMSIFECRLEEWGEIWIWIRLFALSELSYR